MNSSKFRFTLDLHSIQSQYSIPAMLGDTYITLLMSISDGGVPYTIADGCLAKLSIKRPSGSHLEEFCKVSNNAIIEYPFKQNENTCAEAGIHFCDVTLYSPEGEELGSPRFIMVVSEKVVRRDDIELSTDDYTAVDAMLKAEAGRQLEETKRATAEEERVKAEDERAEAEKARAEKIIREILSVEQTKVGIGSGAENIWTVKLTDGSEYSLSVKNGSPTFISDFQFTDDGNGNIILSIKNGTLTLADDGEGNITLEVA